MQRTKIKVRVDKINYNNLNKKNKKIDFNNNNSR